MRGILRATWLVIACASIAATLSLPAGRCAAATDVTSAAGPNAKPRASTPARPHAARSARETSTPRPTGTAASHPSSAHAGAPARSSTSTAGTTATNSRRLSDVHIEGEIPVPQVLFISPQDPRRVTDFQHHRYLPSSRAIGELGVPSRIAVVGGSSEPAQPAPTRSTP